MLAAIQKFPEPPDSPLQRERNILRRLRAEMKEHLKEQRRLYAEVKELATSLVQKIKIPR